MKLPIGINSANDVTIKTHILQIYALSHEPGQHDKSQ